MGAVADGALAAGGNVIGILPRFMEKLEWGHNGVTELRLVEDMRTRKHLMLKDANAVVALPGGCGTFEELFEAITLKRLALYLNPIVIVNTRRFFDPMIQMLESAIEEKFMGPEHANMWSVVAEPEEVPEAIANAPKWSAEARTFAGQ